MSLAVLFFISVAAVSLAASVGVVVSPKPVHSALYLLVNFVTLAVFFVTMGAQFLAAAQVIIYAGGIVILILFVLMLIGSEPLGSRLGHRLWTPYVGLAMGLILVATMLFIFLASPEVPPVGAPGFGAPKAVGFEMFTRYILPFEMVAVLLLVALIGALVLARPRTDMESDISVGVDTLPDLRPDTGTDDVTERLAGTAPQNVPETALEIPPEHKSEPVAEA